MIILLLIIAALAVWQLLAGLAKLRAAGAAGPDDPRGAALRNVGLIQVGVSIAMLVLNIALNWPLIASYI